MSKMVTLTLIIMIFGILLIDQHPELTIDDKHKVSSAHKDPHRKREDEDEDLNIAITTFIRDSQRPQHSILYTSNITSI